MSTPPEKPQTHPPLHNFALPQLNWSKNHSTNLHRGRRLAESSSQTQSPSMNSTIFRFQESVSLQQPVSPIAGTVRRGRPRADRKQESERSQSSPGFQMRMRKKAEEVVEDKEKEMADEDEDEKKSWNFRPRKPQRRPRNGNLGINRYDTTMQEGKSDFLPIAGSSNGMKSAPKNPEKPIFSLTLTPEEIEEDIYAMTGSKPSRKPKRRPKAVQKHLDNIFPGMWLGSVTPDSYNVADPSKKK